MTSPRTAAAGHSAHSPHTIEYFASDRGVHCGLPAGSGYCRIQLVGKRWTLQQLQAATEEHLRSAHPTGGLRSTIGDRVGTITLRSRGA